MIKALFTPIAFLLLTAYAHAQVVKGIIVDASTGNPIRSASIYLDGLSKGTTSNAQGEFALYTNEAKKALIVSSLGYKADTIDNYNGKTLTVKLSPRAQMLREVVIGDKSREKYMKIFLTQFIGSRNKDCIIINPEVINFTYHKETQTLKAKVSQPLIIQNKKLGYKITYFLSAFSHSLRGTLDSIETSYKGNYVFAEDTLELTADEIKEILKARDKAYYGSRMHFIRSVWAKELEKNKFQYQHNNLLDNRLSRKFASTLFVVNNIRANNEQLLYNTYLKGEEYFSYRPIMSIAYNMGFEPHNRGNWSEVTFQSGEITFRRKPDDVPLNPTSYNESNLIWSGKMAQQRIRELLPVNFEPSEPLSKADK
jgi:hypothetical protein